MVYGIHGVCRILDQEIMIVDRKKTAYLVLEPVGQEGARYLVPCDNAAAMSKLRPMLTQQELEALIQSQEVPAVFGTGMKTPENSPIVS